MKPSELNRKARSILGVTDNADKEEMRYAFRQLVKKYHPDKNGNNKYAIDKFKLVSEAYEVLTKEINKGKYSLIKEGSSTTNEDILKDDRKYWEWWMKMFSDFF